MVDNISLIVELRSEELVTGPEAGEGVGFCGSIQGLTIPHVRKKGYAYHLYHKRNHRYNYRCTLWDQTNSRDPATPGA
jgi:hypothetical protein